MGRKKVQHGKCACEGCDREASCQGLCGAHYSRYMTTGEAFDRRPIGAKRRKKPCACEGCGIIEYAHGLCNSHYNRLLKHGIDFDRSPIRRKSPKRKCKRKGCGRKHHAKGLCKSHYNVKWMKAKKKRPRVITPRQQEILDYILDTPGFWKFSQSAVQVSQPAGTDYIPERYDDQLSKEIEYFKNTGKIYRGED